MVKLKIGVQLDPIAPGGFLILQALKKVSTELNIDLTITSGTDGEHSGPHDPHKRGEAYDIRTHDFQDDVKGKVVFRLSEILGKSFYVFLEDRGTSNEHIHAQVAKYHIVSPSDILNA